MKTKTVRRALAVACPNCSRTVKAQTANTIVICPGCRRAMRIRHKHARLIVVR